MQTHNRKKSVLYIWGTLTLFILLLASCLPPEAESSTQQAGIPPNANASESFSNLAVQPFNQQARSLQAEAGMSSMSPQQLTENIFNVMDTNEEGFQHIEWIIDEVNHNQVQITLVQEGLLDDSVKGEKRIIDWRKTDDLWRIQSLKFAVKCQINRGHQVYSPEPCI